MEVLKKNDQLGLRLEFDETADRRYRVVVDGEVVYATNVESSAATEYADIVSERDRPYAEVRARENNFKEGERIRAEIVSRTSRSTHKGGRGGRGGV